MKRFHAAGICDCCDASDPFPDKAWKHSIACAWHDGEPCTCREDPGENPNYGPDNPDWERDLEKDGHSEARLQPGPISTPRQGGRTIDHLT